MNPRLAAVSARYDAGAIIEEGATWTACRATERASGRAVVLRIVEDDRLAQEANAQRFLAEARLVATIDHPGLIKILEAATDGRFGWIASAPASGPTLREVLTRGPLSPEDAASAGEQVAAVLDAVHTRGVIHRDLRLDHVIQVAPGAYRLTGFGLGRWMLAGAKRTDGTAISGLPAVLSPELITGGAAGAATDLHALGLILYELITGRHPFQGDSELDLMEKLVKSYALRPSALVPTISAPLEEIILRALSKDPAGRHFTANAMREALAVCPGASGATGPGPVKKRRTIPTWAEMLSASQTVAQRMRRAALYMVPLVLVAGGLVLLLRRPGSSPAESLQARAHRELESHPTDVALRLQFGEELERQGLTDQAKAMYDDALRVDPKYARAIAGLARLEDRVGRADQARRTYRRAIEVDPRAWFAVVALAHLLEKDGRFNEAKVLVEQGLASTPGQPDLTEELIRLRSRK